MQAQAVVKDMEARMTSAIDALGKDFASVRTGRASTALLDPIRVDYYGTPTPISQMAAVSTPDARTLMIQPWEVSQLKDIEKAITKADLGIQPVNDGKLIRLTMPTPTEERRKQLVKIVRSRAEEARVGIRNVRRHAKDGLGQLEKGGEISQDDERRAEHELQQLTDRHVAEVDSMLQHKEQELLEV